MKVTKLKNIIAELKNTRGIQQQPRGSRKRMSDLEVSAMELNKQSRKNKKNNFKSEDNLRDLWDNMKWNNFHIIGVSEGEERQKEAENLFE